MPGGQLHIAIEENFAITMTGPVTRPKISVIF
jgi:hypothetical protein